MTKSIAGLALCGFLIACRTAPNGAHNIVVKDEATLATFLNVHAGTIHILYVDGKRFPNVRGYRKYYYELPEINSIAFVADNDFDHSVTYHILKLDSGEDIKIHAKSTIFGSSTSGKDLARYLGDGKILLKSEDLKSTASDAPVVSTQKEYCLDINRRVLESEEFRDYTSAGILVRKQTVIFKAPPDRQHIHDEIYDINGKNVKVYDYDSYQY